MTLNWPYKILIAFTMVVFIGVAASPYIAMQALADAGKQDNLNVEQWQKQLKVPYFTEYTNKMLINTGISA